MTYTESWQINKGELEELGYSDWSKGFKDASERVFPKYPTNCAYMMGWLNALGTQAGYANQLPASSDESYLEGYEDAQFERGCYHPNEPDIREVCHDCITQI